MVLRRLQAEIPSLESLHLAPVFQEIVKERNGLVFVTGGSGNGKTTTLAALLNEINRTSKIHIVSLEDPIEFLHPQLKSTFSQRELGRDFFSFPDGLRAALRQAPKVILVGEIRDRETMEIALTAGETGHLVFSTLHTISADQTIHRILGLFTKDEEQQVRERLVGSLRYIVGQRLVPRKSGGRLLVTELMGSSLRTREAIGVGENENRRLHDIIEAGSSAGWHSFEQSLLKAVEQDLITEENAMLYSVNKPTMRQRLDTARARHNRVTVSAVPKPMMVVGAARSTEPGVDPLMPVILAGGKTGTAPGHVEGNFERIGLTPNPGLAPGRGRRRISIRIDARIISTRSINDTIHHELISKSRLTLVDCWQVRLENKSLAEKNQRAVFPNFQVEGQLSTTAPLVGKAVRVPGGGVQLFSGLRGGVDLGWHQIQI